MTKKFTIELTDYERQTLLQGLLYLRHCSSNVPAPLRTPLCKMILNSFSRLYNKLSYK